MIPHFTERWTGVRVLEIPQLSLVLECLVFWGQQGWEMLSEARSEPGCLNDRAGKGEGGLWLRARITSSLVQLGGRGRRRYL